MFRSLDTDDVLFTETGIANGLNQLTSYATRSLTHDSKGNVTAFGGDSFTYSSENLLSTATVDSVLTTPRSCLRNSGRAVRVPRA